MGLADLKKNSQPAKTTQCSIDEFIEGANSYANGEVNIIPLRPRAKTTPQAESKGIRFKRSTFTLTTEHIDRLSELKLSEGINKSEIVRRMIQYAIQHRDTLYKK